MAACRNKKAGMKRKILIGVCVVLAVAGLYAAKEYFRTHDDLSGKKPVADLEASQLITAFETKAAQSRQQYVDKVIRVQGYVTAVAAEDYPVVLTLGEKGTLSSVQCSMDTTQSIDATNLVGQQVAVKGICTGALTEDLFGTDVKLSRCLLEIPKP
ncbi:MAG: hypothetical protein EOO14_12295 [Chitinophagaceae bacterium]|nr:MAG: hypothetical protein EOO14_12295 [Chitinophagaceae bacterium]